MGRHRRSAAGRAARGRATGVTQQHGSATGSHGPRDSYGGGRAAPGIAPYLNPEAYAETTARSEAFLYATDDAYTPAAGTAVLPGDGYLTGGGDRGASGTSTHRRRKKRVARPVRTGLLGVSAAVAIGTVAVAAGVVPGTQNYRLGGGSGAGDIQAVDTPTGSPTAQGGTSGSAETRDPESTSRDTERSTSPTASASTPSTAPGKTPEKKPESEKPESRKPATPPSKKPSTEPTPSRTATKAPAPESPAERTSAPATVSEETAAAAEVLRLVNEERAKVGCSALAANSALSDLAQDFSEDMAARGFFDHTDPDGASPWDRAAKAGVTGLGGENIARGQADAAAVMNAWMNSPGHRANILNCDFKTLGVGVHMGAGGPWWTQDFGY
ncbi:CAP domain-containing protein [Streptomyces sp. NPDC088387]|uniref:CAP domain-containing protein n=1 Tax=Streptomyces sp. NPDC088387 TaxID=3365859 RepID=UPI0038285EF8